MDRPPRVRAPGWLYAVAFVSGAALMAFELAGSRILAPSFGNSIFVWGSLIGVFLGALSVGYAAGGRASDRHPTAGALALVLAAASLLAASVVPIAAPVQAAVVRWDPGVRLNPLVCAVVLFGPASVLMGMVSPFAVRLAAGDLRAIGSTAGNLYAVSTAGSIAGTIGTAFWLIQALGTARIVLVVAGALAACALACATLGRSLRGAAAGALAVLAVGGLWRGSAAGPTAQLAPPVAGFSPVFRAAGYRPPLVPAGPGRERAVRESRYHRIRAVDYPDGRRLLFFDHSLQGAVHLRGGQPDLSQPPPLAYVHAWDLLQALRPGLRRVLFVGVGAGAAPMRLKRLRPDVAVEAVEIDPDVVRIAREWFGYDEAAVPTHVGDARSWLAASAAKYDAIVVDAFFADAVPFHLTTREFVEVLDARLAEGGLLSANLAGAGAGPRSALLRAILRTYAERFPHQLLLPLRLEDERTMRREQFRNNVVFAARAPLPDVAAAFAASPLRADAGLAAMLDALGGGPPDLRGVPLLTDDYAPVDALLALDMGHL